MARISNILTGDTAEPVRDTGAWIFTNTVATIDRENTPTNVKSMLALRAINPLQPMVVEIDSFEIPVQYRGDIVDFGFFIKSEAKIEVTVFAQNDALVSALPQEESFVSQTKTFIPAKNSWVFPRVNRISTGTLETAQFVTIRITISNHDGNIVHLARPVLVPTFFHLEDEATTVLQSYLPPDWLDIDESAQNVVSGAAKLLHSMIIAYQDVYDLHVSIQNLDHIDSWNDGVEEFSSSLVSPNYLNPNYARWLAQFTGSVLIDPSAGLTPWANLPKVWANWALIDSDDEDETVDWSEVMGFNIELIGVQEYFKWQILTQAYAAKGGTLGAMRQAAERVLEGTKRVEITHHPTDPWLITVRTLETETNPLLLASAVYAAKPVGFDLIINQPYLT